MKKDSCWKKRRLPKLLSTGRGGAIVIHVGSHITIILRYALPMVHAKRFPFRSLHTIVRVKTNLAFSLCRKGFSASASLNLQRRHNSRSLHWTPGFISCYAVYFYFAFFRCPGSGHWKLSYSSMGAFLTFFPSIFLSDINKRTPDWTIISQIFYSLKFTDFWAFSQRFSSGSVLLRPLFFLRHYPYHQYRIFPSQNWTLVFNIKTLFQYIRKRI